MKKVLGQTVRDLKREVNKKVLKVPGIEQKVLDATSNEPWGPHGTHLADIAQATRNFNEYQMIMAVLWKRINDTGKNWRHVYKALTVLEYLVAHGSERVIDEIREHAYQISTLSDFQYIDSGGKDQGSNVRKKSQSLVVLVNDKDRIQEVRQKALANRDKYRGPSSTGGIYKPSPYPSTEGGYGDQHNDDRYESRYGNRDDEQSGYGREREWGSRSDDRYGRDGDTYGRDGDRYSRDSDERYGRDGYKDDDYQSGSRHRSSDREKERPYEDGDPQDERQLERKLSEQQIGAPPSYEEAVTAVRSPGQYERDGGAQAATAPKAASPQNGSPNQDPSISVTGVATASVSKEVDSFDEFDPRSPISAAPPAAISAEMDFFGSISELASPNPLAIMPVNSAPTASAADTFADSSFGTTFVALSSASTMLNQPSENPFGEAPFKATSSQDPFSAQPHNLGPTSLPPPSTSEGSQPLQPVALSADPFSDFHFGDSFQGITYPPSAQFPHVNQEFSPQELPSVQSSGDILADILPQSAPAAPLALEVANFLPQPAGPAAFVPQSANPTILTQPAAPAPFAPQSGTSAPFAPQSVSSSPFGPQPGNLAPFAPQPGSLTPFSPQPGSLAPFAPQPGSSAPFAPQPGSSAPFTPQSGSPAPFTPQSAGSASFSQQPMGPSSFSPQPVGPAFYASQPTVPIPFASQPVGTTPFAQQSTGPISLSSQPATAAPMGLPAQSQPQKDKFEPKSTVWADTLSRGLVNLNISGAKINPLADIGIDFDSINRKEKLKEKSSVAQATSTITMGKAMGSGSGMGRAGATGLPPPPNPMIGSGMVMGGGANMGMGGGANMGMGMGGGANMGMGGGANMGMRMGMGSYGGGMNQQPMGMGMGGMGMGQGAQFRPATGLPPSGPALPPGYNPNPTMGMGGYGAQQPHGGYR